MDILKRIDNNEWQNLVNLYDIDVSFSPNYFKIWEDCGDGKAHVVLYESCMGMVLYPFLIRKIDTVSKNGKYFDISTPYGYGGPLILNCKNINNEELTKNFRRKLNDYLYKIGVISEFIRFHPIIENHSLFLNSNEIEVQKNNSVIFVDLSLSEEEIWKNYKANNRKNIKKAIRNDIEVIIDYDFEYIDEFLKIYYSTMSRNNAKKYYYFPKSFFRLIQLFKNNFVLFVSKIKDKIISVEIAFYDRNIIYSFLGGSIPEYFSIRPNNILKHKLILWAKGKKIRYFLLGGGYSYCDGIFKYKNSFSKDGIKDFFIGKKIHNYEIYNLLVREWKQKNNINNALDDYDLNYFPLYRYKI